MPLALIVITTINLLFCGLRHFCQDRSLTWHSAFVLAMPTQPYSRSFPLAQATSYREALHSSSCSAIILTCPCNTGLANDKCPRFPSSDPAWACFIYIFMYVYNSMYGLSTLSRNSGVCARLRVHSSVCLNTSCQHPPCSVNRTYHCKCSLHA